MTFKTKGVPQFTPNLNIATAIREELLDYLHHHLKYFTLKDQKESATYANRIELKDLRLKYKHSKSFQQAFYVIRQSEFMQKLRARFIVDTNYSIAFYSEPDFQYMAMHKTAKTGLYEIREIPLFGIDFSENITEDTDIEQLRQYATILRQFDIACDQITHALMSFILTGRIKTPKYENLENIDIICIDNQGGKTQ